jgi:hypothetical protein
VAAGVVVIYAAAVVGSAAVSSRTHGPAPAMPESIPRVSDIGAVRGDLLSARDFVVVDSTLYILDWRSNQVVGLRARPEGAWSEVGRFGGTGSGPGEFAAPTALGAVPGRSEVAILERDGQVEYFNLDGMFLRSRRLDLPCASSRPQMAPTGADRGMIATSCIGSPAMDLSPDTTYSVLWSWEGEAKWTMLASEAVLSVDGRWGSGYSSSWPLSWGEQAIRFGSGLRDCLLVAPVDDPTRTVEECGLVREWFSAPSPDGFAGRGPLSESPAWAWPDPLPAFIATLETGDQTLLVRSFSADSVVFEIASGVGALPEAGARILVAPVHSFVGCKRAGCLWYSVDVEGGHVSFLSRQEIVELVVEATDPHE